MPPSLCLRNSTTCGQGDVPIYSVDAQTAVDVQVRASALSKRLVISPPILSQAAVKFTTVHNLSVAVKSSGHDYLGRSTAPNSLLIRTANFKNTAFTDAFFLGGQNMGSAVIVGSGVHMQDLYAQAKAQGKIAVGGSAATVSAAGGYLQGGGHSALSPLYGLAADNVLEFNVVLASGDLVQVNSVSNTDRALLRSARGGAGSWGVIVNATIRTFPTFSTTLSVLELSATSNGAAAVLAGVHAQHIFDLDAVRGAQYFYLQKSGDTSVFTISTLTPNTTLNQARPSSRRS
ncbi:hypothetical protein B0H19DRAFT_974116 [Mycena capillaripes]|nr:hypothetical protein B0H19DRAFT_974116 [Mycena capillaripes]